jgi:hypothetical protein
MKIKSKTNIKPAVAHAAGTPKREQTKKPPPHAGANENKRQISR